MTREPPTWRLVVPVRRADTGKTRLPAPPGVDHTDLARALAVDTLTAACVALPGRVHLVTSDPVLPRYAAGLGVAVVPDPGSGLDAAVLAGVADATASAGAQPVAALLGDLPTLRPGDLTAALAACAEHDTAVVPDAAGTGTVLLTSRAGVLDPRFGPGSAARHARKATRLDLDLPRLRRDVDTEEDLRDALELGVGAATTTVLAGATLPEP